MCLIVSWVPFVLLFETPWYSANALGVFVVAILGMWLIEKVKNVRNLSSGILYLPALILYCVCVCMLDLLVIMPEGVLGLCVVLSFYLLKDKQVSKFVVCGILLLLMGIVNHINDGDWVQYFGLLSIVLLVLYNHNKGKLNLKYLFYVGYPAHLLILLILKLIV